MIRLFFGVLSYVRFRIVNVYDDFTLCFSIVCVITDGREAAGELGFSAVFQNKLKLS